MDELPRIGILIPIWNRSKFKPLIALNLKSQIYPHDKLSVYIDDDSDTDKLFKSKEEEDDFRRHISPMKLFYSSDKPKRSIGKKRNDLVKMSKEKIVCMMDSDDVYLKTYITHSYEILKNGGYGCVGATAMIFTMTDKDFKLHAINCGTNKKLIHEASMMMTKKWFNSSCKFANSSQGEGQNLFFGLEKKCGITDISQTMCCVQHSGNSVDKLQFAKEDNSLDFDITEDYKTILRKILNI